MTVSVVYVTQEKSALRKRGERLIVTNDNVQVLDLPMRQVEQVVLLGQAYVSGYTIAELLEQGVPLTYLTPRGKYVGRLEPPLSKNALLRRRQYEAACDPRALGPHRPIHHPREDHQPADATHARAEDTRGSRTGRCHRLVEGADGDAG